jgi:hypothetical protein
MTLPGSQWAETDWHHTFAEQRVAGEWFRYEGYLSWFLKPYDRPVPWGGGSS